MENLLFYFILFLIYSILGWIIEVISVGTKDKKFINRGFLIGPYCPIYGFSAIIMVFYLSYYKDNVLTVFLLAVVVCSIIEYLVSYIMEKLFAARWWDYSNRKCNINGRVCLTNAVAFGILGVLLVYLVNPLLTRVLMEIDGTVLNVVSVFLLLGFMVDFIISLVATFKLKEYISNIKKDSTEEIRKKIKEGIESRFQGRRIFRAFPKFKENIINRIESVKDEVIRKIEEKKNNK